MTKQDFKKLADVIVKTNSAITSKNLQDPNSVLLFVWEALADMAYNDNGNFSYTKFTDYINARIANA